MIQEELEKMFDDAGSDLFEAVALGAPEAVALPGEDVDLEKVVKALLDQLSTLEQREGEVKKAMWLSPDFIIRSSNVQAELDLEILRDYLGTIGCYEVEAISIEDLMEITGDLV